jgi:hypothetical protein
MGSRAKQLVTGAVAIATSAYSAACCSTGAATTVGGARPHRRHFPLVGLLRLLDRGQGGAAPYFYPHPGGIPLTYLPRWAARAAVGVEVEEGLT